MILDLHTHSIKSDDGKAKVKNYCQWIRKRGLELDGFVLTEHRQFDDESDYRKLEDEYGIPIMKASEVETEVVAAGDLGRSRSDSVGLRIRPVDRVVVVGIAVEVLVQALEVLGDPIR